MASLLISQAGPTVLDPPKNFTPGRDSDQFRDYTEGNAYNKRVRNTYYQMHTNQTVDFVRQKMAEWCQFNHAKLTVMEAVDLMNSLVDESDPDVDIANSIHAYQTAERIREVHPDKEWFQLTGLIHDVGKVLAVWGEPQWSVVGDTFPVGCQFSDNIVFGRKSFVDNPDDSHPVYSTKLGMYKEGCGLTNVQMSWGHDEYLYQVLRNHADCKLPDEALVAIRYHSFYPWHSNGDYDYLCNDYDRRMLDWVKEFNKFDLYSKADSIPDTKALESYYQSLVDKYLPGKIKW
jgi:inositol oxygenase